MEAWNKEEFAKALENKGYANYLQFYSATFDFTDKIGTGLDKVTALSRDQAGPIEFSITGYPVWDRERKPSVLGYLSCVYDQQRFRLIEMSLSLKNEYGQVLRNIRQEQPGLDEIPDVSWLKKDLKELTGGSLKQIVKPRSKKIGL